MNTQADSRCGNAEEWNALHDLALRRAHELRREAMDDFWRGANAALVFTSSQAGRSARRLAYRLVRHVRGRSAQIKPLNITRKGA